jgi:hypothetical protein
VPSSSSGQRPGGVLRGLLYAYIALMPVLHALSPLPILSTNVVLLAVAIPFSLFMTVPPALRFGHSDAVVVAVLLYGLAAWLWYPAGIERGRGQGALQWAFSFIGLWLLVRRWILASGVSFYEISRACFVAAILLSICVVWEFGLANTSGKFFSDYVPFSIDEFPQANIFGSTLLRPRVFSAEAGFTAISYELFLPLSIVYFKSCSQLFKYLFIAINAIGVLFLFSVAGILSFIIALALLNFAKEGSRIKSMLTITVLFVFIVSNTGMIDVEYIPFYKIWEFFDSSNYELLQGSRQEALAAGWKLVGENWLGIGWGTVLQEARIPGSEIDRMILGTGLISLWLELVVATGVPAAILLIAYIVGLVAKLARMRRPEGDACFVALVALVLHHIAVYEVWFPMLWFALALAQVLVAAHDVLPCVSANAKRVATN